MIKKNKSFGGFSILENHNAQSNVLASSSPAGQKRYVNKSGVMHDLMPSPENASRVVQPQFNVGLNIMSGPTSMVNTYFGKRNSRPGTQGVGTRKRLNYMSNISNISPARNSYDMSGFASKMNEARSINKSQSSYQTRRLNALKNIKGTRMDRTDFHMLKSNQNEFNIAQEVFANLPGSQGSKNNSPKKRTEPVSNL
jgi:hypothetical protein